MDRRDYRLANSLKNTSAEWAAGSGMRTSLHSVSLLSIATIGLVSVGFLPGASADEDGVLTVGCSGTFAAGETGECVFTFRASDDVDPRGGSFARLPSATGVQWTVTGVLEDARGDAYYTWHCSSTVSAFVNGMGALVPQSCGGNGFDRPGASPPNPGTHTARVTATADVCAEGAAGLCPFKATTKVWPGTFE